MQFYESDTWTATEKADGSPVSDADLAANRVICDGLRQHAGDIPVVTEEDVKTHEFGGASRFLLVDPLDGTKEFINQRGDFTVNIALIHEGHPIMGVLYAPARGVLYLADDKAYREVMDPGARSGDFDRAVRDEIMVREADPSALTCVCSRSHLDERTEAFIGRYSVAEKVSVGSSLKFALLAEGKADLYPRFGRTMEWDIAAGHAILQAAGGRVVCAKTGAAMHYGKPGLDNGPFIAATSTVKIVETA